MDYVSRVVVFGNVDDDDIHQYGDERVRAAFENLSGDTLWKLDSFLLQRALPVRRLDVRSPGINILLL